MTDFCHTFGALKDGSIGMVLMVSAVGGPVGDVLLFDEFVDDVGVDVVGLGTAHNISFSEFLSGFYKAIHPKLYEGFGLF